VFMCPEIENETFGSTASQAYKLRLRAQGAHAEHSRYCTTRL